mmetsp:Transcript_10874/g.26076  ORF Transcript_10874/g.26076 Transcript_10874/m.26076 type:complete len:239 (-) Transcript_10874:1546-2262(-)
MGLQRRRGMHRPRGADAETEHVRHRCHRGAGPDGAVLARRRTAPLLQHLLRHAPPRAGRPALHAAALQRHHPPDPPGPHRLPHRQAPRPARLHQQRHRHRQHRLARRARAHRPAHILCALRCRPVHPSQRTCRICAGVASILHLVRPTRARRPPAHVPHQSARRLDPQGAGGCQRRLTPGAPRRLLRPRHGRSNAEPFRGGARVRRHRHHSHHVRRRRATGQWVRDDQGACALGRALG